MTTFKKGDRIQNSNGDVGIVTRMGTELGAPCVWATWECHDGDELWSRPREVTWLSSKPAARKGDTALTIELAQAVEALADKAER